MRVAFAGDVTLPHVATAIGVDARKIMYIHYSFCYIAIVYQKIKRSLDA